MRTMKNQFQQLFLRIAVSVTMLSAVADRFGLWGDNSSWGTGRILKFTPKNSLASSQKS
ncbi:Uncharacterised protein [Elizabethkingia miricola]|nr:Uncharacterised protein [Elizabethkingia miricola]